MNTASKVWDFLRQEGMTPAGAAGMMGNLKAESGMVPDRVEMLCLKRLAEAGKIYTDATYTAFVDDGTITRARFIHPLPGKQYGYGLCQWTSPSRKGALYDYCKSKKVSIGDLTAQLEFLVKELKDSFPSVWKTLTTTSSVSAASNAVLTKFEMPADTGASVKKARKDMAQAYYDEFVGAPSGTAEKPAAKATAEDVIGIMRSWIGYSEANGKYKTIVDIYNTYCERVGKYPRGYKVPYSVAWCDVTVSAAFIKAEAVDLIGGIECGVEEHIQIFKRKGIWIEDGKITPNPGYIITYNWDQFAQQNDGYADHIGVVESVKDGQIVVIEGNYNDTVQRRSIPVGWGYIRGFAAPDYANAGTTGAKPETKPEAKPEAKPEEENTGKLNDTERWVGSVTASLLNVRTWAGTEYPKIKSWPQLREGNLVSVCDTVKAADGSKWYYIKIADKYYGFISAKYIRRA